MHGWVFVAWAAVDVDEEEVALGDAVVEGKMVVVPLTTSMVCNPTPPPTSRVARLVVPAVSDVEVVLSVSLGVEVELCVRSPIR